ncbi:MAG: GvpL/GvpF family gas vesicle protein, partial [Gemmatimonadaceae bacterium]
MSVSVEYVYCVVPAPLDVHDAPRGLDRAGVRCIVAAGLVAVTSTLGESDYSGDVVSERTGDPEWLTPRAVAHDAVVTWAADRGPVVPFPMWVMFSDERGVLAMLAERAADLDDTLRRTGGAKEFGVRVSGDQAALAAAAEAADSTLVDLKEQAATAPPGQAYLLRRKLAEARKAATRDAALRIANETH